ncbi:MULTISPECIES: anthrone oxygenase family protein [unclassified Streptomyces]|uniref:anthrone oxygenase family protein n=1 Tax=unclassified Streptomyces TaxID=2593676 RepID=UPI002E2E3BAA|nr:anthrone oxygenase family protein [Streptomyces sp. NBC_00342]
MASLFLALAVTTTGLYAGFLLTFLVVVMPGLAALPDDGFTAAMRRINEKVPGPGFLIVFLGVIVFPAITLVAGTTDWKWPLVAGALACSAVSHVVTIAGNIPLNKALAAAEPVSAPVPVPASVPVSAAAAPGEVGEGGEKAGSVARTAFEARWNILHQARTALSLAAFILLIIAAD